MGTKFGPKKGEDTATNTILRKLAILVPTYYVLFYIVACITTAAFGVPIDGKEPFDFVNFNPAEGGRSSGKFAGMFLLAMVPIRVLCPLYFSFVFKKINHSLFEYSPTFFQQPFGSPTFSCCLSMLLSCTLLEGVPK